MDSARITAVGMQHYLLLSLVLLPAAAAHAETEVFIYGEEPTLHPAHQGTPWTYDGAGDDWVGFDGTGKPWVCMTGQQQSPVNLPVATSSALTALASEHKADFSSLGTLASNGSNLWVANNGHTVQVSWVQPTPVPHLTIAVQEGQPLISSVALSSQDKVQQVAAVPKQFHFHAHSEHLVAGHLFPLEAHIVSVVEQSTLPSCPPSGCVVVTGVLFELSDDINAGSAWLEPLFQAMPLSEGEVAYLPAGTTLDLQQFLPSNRSYISYAGSLTTPPCTEGVLWLVMINTQKMSLQQWRKFMKAVGDYNCTLETPVAATSGSQQQQGSTSNGTVSGRKLLEHSHIRGLQRSGRQVQQEVAGQPHYVCDKLGRGGNARLPQPLSSRVLRLWRDKDDTKKSSYLPEDAASAASAGAVAGIVIGTSLGAGLTALIGWVAYREYQKRRLKRFYRYGVSSGDMLSVQREVETQWLGANGSGSSGPVRPY